VVGKRFRIDSSFGGAADLAGLSAVAAIDLDVEPLD
jgi:hypothetical protein